MEELKDKYIRFDWAIKRLLRQKANFGVLEGFLTVFPDFDKNMSIIFTRSHFQEVSKNKW